MLSIGLAGLLTEYANHLPRSSFRDFVADFWLHRIFSILSLIFVRVSRQLCAGLTLNQTTASRLPEQHQYGLHRTRYRRHEE